MQISNKFSLILYRCRFAPPDYPLIFATGGCETFAGYTADELAGGEFSFMKLVHQDDVLSLQTTIDKTLAIGAPLETVFRLQTKDGEIKKVLSNWRVSETDSNGMPSVLEAYIVDITKQLQMEISSSVNQRNLEFWSKMGFEIRTPMHAILGLAEMGMREDLPEQMREYSQIIKHSGSKLMIAFGNIIDSKHLENGTLEIVSEEYSLSVVIANAVDFVKQEYKTLDFYVFVQHDTPNKLIGDSVRLQQILQCLLSNAVKFTDAGFISLSIES